MSRLPAGGQQRHVEYDMPESCSSSSVGLPHISLRGNLPHSQSWTVVPEYNMSLRQQKEIDPFEYWKCDVQSQIANMADKLRNSLEQYPDPSTRYLKADGRSSVVESDFERRKAEQLKQQTRTITNSLAYGLGRK
ncbi:uncharacterized protein LOC110979704 [Acanthaster planci]|uniref:Uncharacterized protein LOC110979704 n=1 Tax=Acanthaster planci TaxID=133434 RepID=A0A8B7YDV6_ACAPL|nr:uncharacterized protein LOC110979704 [Acanthaster planci]